jgi:hypothetical protein
MPTRKDCGEARPRGPPRRGNTSRRRTARLEGQVDEEQSNTPRAAATGSDSHRASVARDLADRHGKEPRKPCLADAARLPSAAREALRVQSAAREGRHQASRPMARPPAHVRFIARCGLVGSPVASRGGSRAPGTRKHRANGALRALGPLRRFTGRRRN